MFYPESDIIASKYPQLASEIGRIDEYLYEREGKPFYAVQPADKYGVKLHDVEALLEVYRQDGVVREERIWLCPKDEQEIEFASDGVLHCDLCGNDYEEGECREQVLYQARLAEGKPAEPSQTEQSESVPEDKSDEVAVAEAKKRSYIPRLTEPRAILIQGLLGCLGPIVAAILAAYLTGYFANSMVHNTTPTATPTVESSDMTPPAVFSDATESATPDITSPATVELTTESELLTEQADKFQETP